MGDDKRSHVHGKIVYTIGQMPVGMLDSIKKQLDDLAQAVALGMYEGASLSIEFRKPELGPAPGRR
jgi:hypothetical protein